MTLQQKIERYKLEKASQCAGRPQRIPAISRLLWRFDLDVPPTDLWPTWAFILAWAIPASAVVTVINVLPFWPHPHPWHSFAGAMIFGLMITGVWRSNKRRRNYSPWYGAFAEDSSKAQ